MDHIQLGTSSKYQFNAQPLQTLPTFRMACSVVSTFDSTSESLTSVRTMNEAPLADSFQEIAWLTGFLGGLDLRELRNVKISFYLDKVVGIYPNQSKCPL
jgi:hypothetical protein